MSLAPRHPLGQAPRAKPELPERSIGWREARQLAASAAKPLGSETVEISEALGRVLALDLHARHDVPHYASAAMDGWAVRGPAPWQIVDPEPAPALGISSARGTHSMPSGAQRIELEPGQAVPIVTGALVPTGAEAVLRTESGTVESASAGSTSRAASGSDSRQGVLFVQPAGRPDEPFPGQHIRPVGEEARRGDTIIRAGTRLNPAHIAVAALGGHDVVDVVKRPLVGFVFTGDEVDEHGSPPPGRVRDSFGPQLPGLLKLIGARVVGRRRASDTLASTVTALETSIREAHLVITTGGTGRSSADQLRDALHELGARIVFDGVAMRPGGPTILARAKNGSLVVCLPGNPLAAMVGLLVVAVPVARVLGGAPVDPLVHVWVGGEDDISGREATALLVPFTLVEGRAVPCEHTGSAMMRGLADADGILEIPADGLSPGARAWSLSLPWT